MKSKTVIISGIVAAVVFAGSAHADDKTMLEELSEYRQKMQLENVQVQYLEAKKRRLELELDIETVGDTEPLPVVLDSTSFSEAENDPSAKPENAPPPGNVASWGAPQAEVRPAVSGVEPPPSGSRIRLLDVAGFSDDLKAVISINDKRKTVRNAEKVRGTKVEIVKIYHDYIELIDDGETRYIDMAGEPASNLPRGDVDLVPQGLMSGDTSFSTNNNAFPSDMGVPGMQPLPVSK